MTAHREFDPKVRAQLEELQARLSRPAREGTMTKDEFDAAICEVRRISPTINPLELLLRYAREEWVETSTLRSSNGSPSSQAENAGTKAG